MGWSFYRNESSLFLKFGEGGCGEGPYKEYQLKLIGWIECFVKSDDFATHNP